MGYFNNKYLFRLAAVWWLIFYFNIQHCCNDLSHATQEKKKKLGEIGQIALKWTLIGSDWLSIGGDWIFTQREFVEYTDSSDNFCKISKNLINNKIFYNTNNSTRDLLKYNSVNCGWKMWYHHQFVEWNQGKANLLLVD